MKSVPRYALYFVPAADRPLYQFGRAALGYDWYTGKAIDRPPFQELAAEEWDALAREPRLYGFHGTLKAPFRLLPSCDEAALVEALATFAAAPRALPVIELCVRALGPFVVLAPREPCPALDALAAACVTHFDSFRAPLTHKERERRLAGGLTPEEVANLDRWGYPFVFEAFRFHMTLTGPVAAERREDVVALLQKAFSQYCRDAPVAVDRLALLRQDDARSRLRVAAQAGLSGNAAAIG
jgi:putative phosphonate metabolism protein